MGKGSNRILLADNLKALRKMESESIDLIYIDPRSTTGRRQTRPQLRTIRDENGDRTGFGDFAIAPNDITDERAGPVISISSTTSSASSGPRMQEALRLLTPTGSSSSTSTTARCTTAR